MSFRRTTVGTNALALYELVNFVSMNVGRAFKSSWYAPYLWMTLIIV